MAQKSFWENLGRGIGEGLRKARDVTERLTDQAEGKLDLRRAQRALENDLRRLGEAVAERAVERGEGSVDLEASPLREMVEAVRAGREEIARLEAEIEAKAAEEANARAAAESAETDFAEPAETSTGSEEPSPPAAGPSPADEETEEQVEERREPPGSAGGA
ncbi:MAG: hypothetical protein JXA90_02340 [Planctomycetes bacterium]|nr:hypothetical protein [Planctomycetota bacterium]